MTSREMPAEAQSTAAFEQDHVAPREIHVLVGRVVFRRLSDGPVIRGIDIAHVDCQRDERPQVPAAALARGTVGRGALRRLPRQAGADVDWLDVAGRSLFREENRAVEAAREEDGGSVIGSSGNLVIW